MRELGRRFPLAAAAAALLATAVARAEPAPPANDDEARARFVQATEAADRGDLETARALYASVWLVRQTYDVAMNLAEIEAHLGRDADAATHAACALALFPPSEDPDTRRHLAALLERSRTGLAEVTVTAPAGARVSVDGGFVGTAPLAAPVFLLPGRRALEAASGGRTTRTDIEAKTDERHAATLTFAEDSGEASGAGAAAPAEAPSGAGAVGPAPLAARDAATHRPSALVPLIVSAGATALGASLGVGFAILAHDAREEAERLDTPDDTRCTRSPTAVGCAELGEEWDRVDRDRTARDLSFVGAGVGLAATGLFAVLLAREDGRSARLAPVIAVDVDAVRVGVRGSLPAGPPGHRGWRAARAR